MKTERPRFIPTPDQLRFASQFPIEDWNFLCAVPDFNAALEDRELGVAEVIARTRLFARDQASIERGAIAMVSFDREHGAVAEFVSRWAMATGRTGRAHKQSRQAHIRKLVKHGLASGYAEKMKAEAGMA